jgi:NADPH:quinone reductase and related Zn-dependent oxidoreductases
MVNPLTNDQSPMEVVELKRKSLKPKEVRIKKIAAAVNRPDKLMTEG